MKISKLKSQLSHYVYNAKGWKTNRKIVVIESDDWGSERTPTKKAYNDMLAVGLRVDLCPFSKFDTIESDEDLIALYEVLGNNKDKYNRSAVMTANFNVANPNFEQISKFKFEKYFSLNYEQTLDKYNGRSNVRKILTEGIRNQLIFPQYHGKEHLNPYIWLDEIRAGNKGLQLAFNSDVYGIGRAVTPDIKKLHLAALLFRDVDEEKLIMDSLEDGYDYFSKFFKYKPESFIAPVYTWNEKIEQQLLKLDINIIQSSYYQKYFAPYHIMDYKLKFKTMGSTNPDGQTYTVRNSVFEPSISPSRDNVGACLQSINAAFLMHAPAIISTHRLNYMGSLEESNRNNNLNSLNELLSKILRRWPDVEFMNSAELGKLMRGR